MPAAPFWEDVPDAWDTITIAGSAMPGLALVTGSGIGRQIDVKRSPGRDGARLRDRGYENAEFEIEIRVWEAGQLEDLQRRLEELHPKRRGGTRNPLDVAHPALAILGVTSMYVKRIGMPVIKGGVLSITLSCVEWYQTPRPRPTISTDQQIQAVVASTIAIGNAINAVNGATAFERYEQARERPSGAP